MQRPIYNPTDDYLYGLKNGQWVKSSVRLFLNAISVFKSGVFGVVCDNGVYKPSSSDTIVPFTNNGTNLTCVNAAGNGVKTLVTQDAIDFTTYNTVKIVINGTSYTVDVSDYSGVAYVAVTSFFNTTNQSGGYVGIVSQKSGGFNGYRIKYTSTVVNSLNIAISEITVE